MGATRSAGHRRRGADCRRAAQRGSCSVHRIVGRAHSRCAQMHGAGVDRVSGEVRRVRRVLTEAGAAGAVSREEMRAMPADSGLASAARSPARSPRATTWDSWALIIAFSFFSLLLCRQGELLNAIVVGLGDVEVFSVARDRDAVRIEELAGGDAPRAPLPQKVVVRGDHTPSGELNCPFAEPSPPQVRTEQAIWPQPLGFFLFPIFLAAIPSGRGRPSAPGRRARRARHGWLSGARTARRGLPVGKTTEPFSPQDSDRDRHAPTTRRTRSAIDSGLPGPGHPPGKRWRRGSTRCSSRGR
jgi:hypothetical protein